MTLYWVRDFFFHAVFLLIYPIIPIGTLEGL